MGGTFWRSAAVASRGASTALLCGTATGVENVSQRRTPTRVPVRGPRLADLGHPAGSSGRRRFLAAAGAGDELDRVVFSQVPRRTAAPEHRLETGATVAPVATARRRFAAETQRCVMAFQARSDSRDGPGRT